MKRNFKNISYLLIVAALATSCVEKQQQTTEFPDWAWTEFQRPAGVNPIISPDTSTVFYCPKQVILSIRQLPFTMEK